jgi:hypothetical protein
LLSTPSRALGSLSTFVNVAAQRGQLAQQAATPLLNKQNLTRKITRKKETKTIFFHFCDQKVSQNRGVVVVLWMPSCQHQHHFTSCMATPL